MEKLKLKIKWEKIQHAQKRAVMQQEQQNTPPLLKGHSKAISLTQQDAVVGGNNPNAELVGTSASFHRSHEGFLLKQQYMAQLDIKLRNEQRVLQKEQADYNRLKKLTAKMRSTQSQEGSLIRKNHDIDSWIETTLKEVAMRKRTLQN